jgi:hypothetical protein
MCLDRSLSLWANVPIWTSSGGMSPLEMVRGFGPNSAKVHRAVNILLDKARLGSSLRHDIDTNLSSTHLA